MKPWQLAWLVIATIWSNALGLFLLVAIVTGAGPHLSLPEDLVAICLLGFTLPAALLFVVFGAIAWAVRALARRPPRQPSRVARLLRRGGRRSLVHTNPA